MELETRKENEILYVKPLGKRIDASNSTFFKGALVDFIVQGENRIILNLGSVEFIDSSGLGSIITILKTISTSKGSFALCEVNPMIMNLFSVTRVDKVLSITSDEIQARKIILQNGGELEGKNH